MPTVIQWVRHLESQIAAQAAYANPWETRYQNRYVIPFVQREYREVYGSSKVDALMAIRPPRTGTAAVVVDALAERMSVIGATDDGGGSAAELVERAWAENDLDVMHGELHREAMIKARSFVQVSRSTDGRAIVGIDSAEQVAVHRMSAPPYDVDAALKIAVDEWTGQRMARLWLPGRNIDLAYEASKYPSLEGTGEWSRWRIVKDEPSGLPWVPVWEAQSQPRLLAQPTSVIESIDTMVDIVDLIEALMVFAGHFGAVPIRWATGLEVPRDPKDKTKVLLDAKGKPLIGFDARADKLWVSTSDKTQFGQFTPATLDGFTSWAEHASARIRERTGVASTYLSLDLKSHMSAELLKTDEAPMVRRVNRMAKSGSFGQVWRRVMQTILAIEDPAMAGKVHVKPRWESPATRIETQDADTFSKLAPHLGASVVAQKVLGWSPIEAETGIREAADIAAAKAGADAQAVVAGMKPLMASGLDAEVS
ncbi:MULTISPECIES: hypothetical protein [unclassified Luteococcus]|uniref:hypothetical protein n=1 Tax=unclassified Luteococcus TaxID=2639923 RepID=UPI00313CC467